MENNLWTRRTNSGKLSLSTSSNGGPATGGGDSIRNGSFSKRVSGDSSSHGKSNPFNAVTTPGSGLVSPTASASNAFGLGSGAFASFGSAKTPKTPGNPFDLAMGNAKSSTKASEKAPAPSSHEPVARAPSMAPISENPKANASTSTFKTALESQPASARTSTDEPKWHIVPWEKQHHLKYEWVTWCRPPQKGQPFKEYAETLTAMIHCRSIEEYSTGLRHLLKPSQLSIGWEYHFFKRGIRPVWEDEENRSGGKWVLRLKKGVADLYWELTQFALFGEAFIEVSDEICGAVVSVRNGEDIISIWTRSTGGRVLRIRETWKKYLECPPNTIFEFKTHDESIQHRAAIEDARSSKQHHDKRIPGVKSGPDDQKSSGPNNVA